MDINNKKIYEQKKLVIEFGAITDAEYDVLCSTSFGFQGRALATNYEYTEIVNKKALVPRVRKCVRKRIASAFEFPNMQWIDQWLASLPPYFKKVE